MTFSEASEYIEKSGRLGSIMGLSRMERLCDILGNPQNGLKVIHVAGTNGKGSICAMISSIIKAAGYKCGTYNSPALTGLRDHYRIGGELIGEEDYALLVEKIKEADEQHFSLMGENATQFELETALAFLYFEENKCDFAVVEVGMGGRDDATNIIKHKEMCVFSSISLDHTEILGKTVSDIAEVKSGIINCSCPVVMFDSASEAVAQISKQCEKYNNSLFTVKPEDVSGKCDFPSGERVTYKNFNDVHVGLSGEFQRYNAAVAIEAALLLGTKYNVTDSNIADGLRNVYWPFRFEIIGNNPLTIVDGAHNPGAAATLKNTIEERLNGYHIVMVVGMFKDKDCEGVLSQLLPLCEEAVTVDTPVKSRVLDSEKLADKARKYCKNVLAAGGIKEARVLASDIAAKMGEKCAIVAFGSLSYLSEFKNAKS